MPAHFAQHHKSAVLKIALTLFLAFSVCFLLPTSTQAAPCNDEYYKGKPRFQINENKGTVKDIKTGITWKRCLLGLSGKNCEKGIPTLFKSIKQAREEQEKYKDWRLPDESALRNLLCFGNEPAINLKAFPNKDKYLYPNSGNKNSFVFSNRHQKGHSDVGRGAYLRIGEIRAARPHTPVGFILFVKDN